MFRKLGLDNKIKNQIFNIGPDEESTTINELAEIVSNETGFNENPIHVDDRPQEVKIAICSANKARKYLNYKTSVGVREAVKLTTLFIKKRGVKKFKYSLPIEIKSKITPSTWTKKLI